MSEPVLEGKGVVMTLGHGAASVQALKGIDLALHAGEMTLLMGPSGSGKTTLLSILGCVLTPTAGAITVAGRTTRRASAARRWRRCGRCAYWLCIPVVPSVS